MFKLRELITNYLMTMLQKQAFKNWVKAQAATIPEFDPDSEQETLTPTQVQWIEEALTELK